MPKQTTAVEMFYNGVWNDLTAPELVFTEDQLVITRGQGDVSQAPRPCSITCQLNNADDRFRFTNPTSPLFGVAGRNAPVRVKVGGTIRGVAQVSSLQPDQTPDFRRTPRRGKAWADMEAGGLLQQINQWTEPLRSPFYIFNTESVANLAGYWPMEDARGALTAFSPVEGSRNSALRGISFDSQKRPPGSAPVADFQAAGIGTFYFTGGDQNSTAGWQYSTCVYMPSLASGAYDLMRVTLANFGGAVFILDSAANQVELTAYDPAAATLGTIVTSDGGQQWTGQWIMLVMEANYNAGTTTLSASWRGLGDAGWLQVTTTGWSGIPGALRSASVTGATFPDGTSFGHALGANSPTTDLLSDARWDAFTGHDGERTGYRLSRLLVRAGITHFIRGDPDVGQRMGPQPVDSLPNLLREIVTTEDGLLFDEIGSLALIFTQRDNRYNQTPALTLTPTDFPVLPREAFDDQGLANYVTASQRDGGDATAVDSSSALGTQAPPAGVGEYRQTVDVNVAEPESDLPQHANWWLRRGTVDLPRYPKLTLDLNAKPSLVSAVNGVDVGEVIEITGFRENTIRLHVLGYTETIGNNARSITFTCAPDQPFAVGEYDDVARYDSATTMLTGPMTPTQTSVKIGDSDPMETWSTSTPYDVMVAGERITVTTMGAANGDATISTSTFEAGTNNYLGSSCTIAQDATFAHGGSFAGLMTVTGSPTAAWIFKDFARSPSVVPGRSYTLTAWVRSTVLVNDVRAQIIWLEADGTNLAFSSSGSASLAAGAWVQRQFTVTAPADAVWATYGVVISGSPAAGTAVYVDDLLLTAADITYQSMTVTRSVNGVSKSQLSGAPVRIFNQGRYAL